MMEAAEGSAASYLFCMFCIYCTERLIALPNLCQKESGLSTDENAVFERKIYLYTELSTVSTGGFWCGQAQIMETERTDVL